MEKSIEDIVLEYKNSLTVPDENPVRQIFFCPVGLIGAGKTTVTTPVALKLDLVRISNDELRKLLQENGYDYSPLRDMGKEVAYELAQDGYSIAFDMDCGNPETKEAIEALAEEFDALIFWVHIDTPEEFILNKLRNHPPSWLASDPQVMIDNYNKQKAKRAEENTKFDFFYTFDTSKRNVNEQIEECVKLINEEIGQS